MSGACGGQEWSEALRVHRDESASVGACGGILRVPSAGPRLGTGSGQTAGECGNWQRSDTCPDRASMYTLSATRLRLWISDNDPPKAHSGTRDAGWPLEARRLDGMLRLAVFAQLSGDWHCSGEESSRNQFGFSAMISCIESDELWPQLSQPDRSDFLPVPCSCANCSTFVGPIGSRNSQYHLFQEPRARGCHSDALLAQRYGIRAQDEYVRERERNNQGGSSSRHFGRGIVHGSVFAFCTVSL